VTIRARPA
jgi:transposase InsO family protein